jgi:AmmeMemoRadiSam system protein B
MKTVRNATVSGMFYEENKFQLINQLKKCFDLTKIDSGNVSNKDQDKSLLKAIIVPHAGYVYSGGIAAFGYNVIQKQGFADVFIILGPNHSGIGSGVAMSSRGYWKTPLGEIPVDERIIKNLAGGIIDMDDSTLQIQENSIEVQLPFLQYISNEKPFSIIPIAMLMQDKETATDVGSQIANVIKHEKRKVILIASTDFSHEGFAYGRIPPDNLKANEYVTKQDGYALEAIQELNPRTLINIIEEKNISMCGSGPVAAVLTASKNLGATSVELLKYGTSYDVHPDSNACVGYASLAIH